MSEKYEEYYETIDLEEFMDSSLDPNHPFYEEIYKLYYPEVKEVDTKEGMASVISYEFLLSRHHKDPTVFYPKYDYLEILTKNSEDFKVKQTIVATQDDDSEMDNNYDNNQIYKRKWKMEVHRF